MGEEEFISMEDLWFVIIVGSVLICIILSFMYLVIINDAEYRFEQDAERISGVYVIEDIEYVSGMGDDELDFPFMCEYKLILDSGMVVETNIDDLGIGKKYKMCILNGNFHGYNIMWLEKCNEIYE